ncbi:MAG TPA: hypothetical protein VFI06_04715 [Chitinophagaceae bacterium]|nr:hypothetical protein [Chitinophagaceae bacterium]
MTKDTIVQFICITSILEPDEFMDMWDSYANLHVDDPANILLREGVSEKSDNKFNYVLQHVCGTADFRFAFMKERSKMHPPEQKARIKLAGGYLPLQFQSKYNNVKDDARIVVFVGHGENDLEFYRGQSFHYLNIYEAYFENCAYSYVMEFFLHKQDAPELLAQLKTRPRVEAALYKECPVSHSSKKLAARY